jgi:hypothetical protein
VPLAVAQGWIPRETVAHAWELWPFLLIGAGVGLILSRTRLRALGGIIVAGTLGTILGAMLAVGVGGISIGSLGCGSAPANAPLLVQDQGSFAGGTGSVRLAANCASVHVTTASGSGWGFTAHGTENARPTVVKDAGRVEVRSPDRPVVAPFGVQRATWEATLPRDPTRLDLAVDLNAGDASVDLASATLSRLSFDGNAVGSTTLDLHVATVDELDVGVNAGAISVLLPTAAGLVGTIEGNASSISLCAVRDVGLRLQVDDNITASNNYAEQGLTRTGNTWESPGYATAATRIELRTIGSAVSYKLQLEDGCQ